MTATIAALRATMKRCGLTQATLAAGSGVTHSTINRYLSGRLGPQQCHIDKICTALPPSESVQLALAWLTDHIPPTLAQDIAIHAANPTRIMEYPVNSIDLSRTPKELSGAIRTLTSMAEHDEDLADALISLAKTLQNPQH
jgi:transcriptional regulator with XRE-family HTH domain